MAGGTGFSQLEWDTIPGAYETELASVLRLDASNCCNSYLLRSPEYAILVDPGTDSDEADALAGLMAQFTREMPRQAMICLTHCHADHCLGASRILDTPGLIISLVCHKLAADALRNRDADLTGATVLDTATPHAAKAIALFALPTSAGVARDMETPGGSLRCLTIPIGPRDALQVYHTPGHSPDGLCFRVGGALITGDILCPEEPGMPRLPGHDPEELEHTLNKLLWLLDHANIVAIYPGHGTPMNRTQAGEHFRALRAKLNA
ncbi:MBL fold metallo-hydrolase [Desulfovibrio ferrophilus]|uniref:Beta-lactamase domain protein n=1 Tax=Desulfovibrio ferrophilus TaxID=241368 RepID=A0A2Z6AZD8_9BACT|nr:MBL fold metallo-hydrolase [Desulfovibrio ferrophilus]BBD08609.1 beta-lactamase domain protein [Desulfovibrio ferrophilus]